MVEIIDEILKIWPRNWNGTIKAVTDVVIMQYETKSQSKTERR